MVKNLSVTFLGTSSGGGPSSSRSCSSLAISLDSEIWLVDCAEGTQIQLNKAGLKVSRISRIFITHLHVDHCMGIVPLMCTLMYGMSGPPRKLDIYGPAGLRQLVRMTLDITQAHLSGSFAIHELLHHGTRPSCSTSPDQLHSNERPGLNIPCDQNGQWKYIESTNKSIRLDAGPIIHRVPCIGYVFTEAPRPEPFTQEAHFDPIERNKEALIAQGIRNPRSLLGALSSNRKSIILPDDTILYPPALTIAGRKLVILGDTCDPVGMRGIAEGASLLVHEATNAYVEAGPGGTLNRRMTPAEKSRVKEKALVRGHSTAEMAGFFAKSIGTERLYLNHFSTKYPDPGKTWSNKKENATLVVDYYTKASAELQASIIRAIEDEAGEAWGRGRRAVAASDLMTIEILEHEAT